MDSLSPTEASSNLDKSLLQLMSLLQKIANCDYNVIVAKGYTYALYVCMNGAINVIKFMKQIID